MRRKNSDPLPPGVGALRKRIEQWRRTRKRRKSMPGKLWDRAADLAAAGGICRIAHAVGVDYGTLRTRVEKMRSSGGAKGPSPAGFISLDTACMPSPNRDKAIVELSDDDGSKLIVRVTDRVELDVLALANAFWNRRA